jgi:hypothetical protein
LLDQYNFEGRYDLVRFIREIHAQGLYVSLRIGPSIEAEWKYGYESMTFPCAQKIFISMMPQTTKSDSIQSNLKLSQGQNMKEITILIELPPFVQRLAILVAWHS